MKERVAVAQGEAMTRAGAAVREHWARDCPLPPQHSRGGGDRGKGRGGGAREGRSGGEPSIAELYSLPDSLPGSRYVDTHCHLDRIFPELKHNSFAELKKQFPPGFEACISVYCDPAAYAPSLMEYPDHLKNDEVYAAFGCHPHQAKEYVRPGSELERRIREAMQHPKAVAWGECGLDYFRNNSPPEDQRAAFIAQIKCAVELKKPLVVHSRQAEEDTMKIFREHLPRDWKVHVHCFSDNADFARKILTVYPNAFIGITGAVTFQKATDLQAVVRDVIPLERLLLETDGPYMQPRGKGSGGKTSHPGWIVPIAIKVAQLKGKTLQEVRENARKMYGI